MITWEMKLIIHYQTFTVQPLKSVKEPVISSHTLLGMWLHFHDGIEVKPLRPSDAYMRQ